MMQLKWLVQWVRNVLTNQVPHYTRWGLYPQVAALVGCYGYWRMFPIIPGVAIAGLAFVAVVMTVRADKFSLAERVVWVVIGFAIMVFEVRTIYQDREANDAQHSAEATREQSEFKATLQEFKRQSRENQELLWTTQSVASLAKRSLESVTGGNNVAVLVIEPSLPRSAGQPQGDVGTPMVFSPSRGIVRGVTVRMVNTVLFDQDAKTGQFFAHDLNFSIGDLSAASAVTPPQSITLGPGNFVRFNIFFSSLNGFWNENLLMRKTDGQWHQAIRVFRKYTSAKNQTDRDVVFKQIDPKYLRQEEKMDWDAMPKP